MERYIVPALTLALCSSCTTTEPLPRTEILPMENSETEEIWRATFAEEELTVREILMSDRESPELFWVDHRTAYTSENGIHIPHGMKPGRNVVVHELAHWHNPHFGKLPAIVEEGLALEVVFMCGASELVSIPEIYPPYDGLIEGLDLSYIEFSKLGKAERWYLSTAGFVIVNRIGLRLLIEMSDVSPERIVRAAGLR